MRLIPNQGVLRSARNAVAVGSSVGLAFGLVFWVTGWLTSGLSSPILLLPGLFLGQILGLGFGGFACLQHFVLRLILYAYGYIPLNYTRFLNYAAERIFLRKIGGGYIFVHRLLFEYFSSLELEQAEQRPQWPELRDIWARTAQAFLPSPRPASTVR